MSDFSDDDFDAAPTPAPVADAAVVCPCAPSGDVATHSWRIDVPGATVHAQVIRMVDQLVVWVGAAPPGIAPTHGDVAMALPGRPGSSGVPPATTLLGGGAIGRAIGARRQGQRRDGGRRIRADGEEARATHGDVRGVLGERSAGAGGPGALRGASGGGEVRGARAV